MGCFFFLWPLAALASFTAKTQEVPDGNNYHLSGPDGYIDQIVLTFDQNVMSSSTFVTDFEVVGYQILNASTSGADVTLNVVGTVQDSGATPIVYFHPGRLQYSATANIVSAGQITPLNTTATDACAPVWDISYGSSAMLAPVLDSDFAPHNSITQPAGLYAAFSEKVNLASANLTLFLNYIDPLDCVSIVKCNRSVTWATVGGAGGSSLNAVSHAKGTGLCEDSGLLDKLGFEYNSTFDWKAGVKEIAPMSQSLQIRKIQNNDLAQFSSAANALGTGFTLSDAATSFMVSNNSICQRGGTFTNPQCPTTPLIQPKVTVSSLDLDGNGKVDTIQVLTKQHRVDLVLGLGGLYSAGAANFTMTYRKEARPLLDTLVMSNRSLWSLPGYNITSMVEERGRVLLTVTEPATVDTTPIASTLSYNGTLTTWTGNVLGASGIPVTDRICPVITGVKGTGGTNAVYIFFSENVSSTINYTMFLATYGSSFAGIPFSSGALNDSNVFVGYLPANLTSANFNANQQLLSVSGLSSITQIGGGCTLRRRYVSLSKLDTTPPNITAVYTRDFNANGLIDGVSVKFSERVSDSTVNALQFSFFGYNNLTFVASTLNDDIVEFTVNENPGINTTATPTFTALAGVFLSDLSDNAMNPQVLVSTDGVGPYPLSARTATDLATLDLNKIIITFSEPVFNGSASEFSIISPSNIAIVNYSAVGAVATLYVSSPTPVPSDTNVTVGFTRNKLQDTLGNLAPNFTVVAVDGVPPACGAVGNFAITEDTDANGHIDRITLSCGEAVIGGNASSYLVAGYTVIGINSSPGVCPNTYTNCLYIFVQEKTYFDTDAKPSVAYTASPSVTDLLGNPMGNLTFVLVDRTPPVLTRILTRDTNGDGKIDTFRLEFSEPMSNPVGLGPMWNIAGYTVPAFVSSSGLPYLDLIANATGGGYDGGATPNVTVAANGAKDSASNSLGAYMNFRTTDGVFPLVFNVSTAGSCKLTLLQISMSENVNLSSVNTSSFTIPGYNVTGAILGGVLPYGFSLQVAPYPLLTPDAITPSVSYGAPLSIVDNGGNAMMNFTKTAIDALAPCMVLCSGHVGGSYVAITFSEPVSTGASNATLGLINFQLNSSVGTSGISMNSTSAYQITVNAPFIESDINFAMGDTFASIRPVSIHDTNNIAATNSCYVFNDDITPPRLLSAVTVNSDTDAMIDRIVLTFDDQVKDSTFNVSHWNVSNYGIANFSTGATANDNVVYLNLVIKSIPDTGATPTVTYTKPPFGGASDRNRNLLNSTSMVAADGAVPMLVSFAATILSVAQGGNIAIATFSEPVAAANGSALGLSNFIYTSTNGNASSIQIFLDADASDQIATMRLNALALADFTGDSVVATVWDNANLSSTNRSVPVTKGDTTPPILVQAKTGDMNQDGKIDHLTIVFNESMLNTSFNIAAFSLASYSLSSLVVNDNTVDFVVNGSGQLDGNATPAFTYTAGLVADLNGNFLQNFSVNASDAVRPFLVDCSSTLPNIRDVECRFSESVTAINSDFVLGGPLSGANITSPPVASTGEVITIRLSRALVLLDFKNNGTVDLTNGTLVDGANNFGIPRAVFLRNTDIFPPNLTAAFTRDTNCNGFIDAIELVFSEGVISTSVNVADFTVGGGFAFTGVVSPTADASIVRLVVTESATPNTDAGNFPLTYTPGNLTDLSENRALAFNVTVRDGAGVALLSVLGTVDQSVVNVTFSGAIADANVSGFRLLNFSSQIAAMVDSNGADSQVSFQMTATLSPRDFILPAQIDPLVVDPDGNTACRIVALTNPDKSLPTVASITTFDENGDGYLDGFLFNCSKPIYGASLNMSDFSVVNYTVINVTALQTFNLFKLYIAQKNGTVDASMTPQVSYTKGSLTDRYGNALASFSNMQSMDGAGPAIVSAIGLGSSLTLTFSKPIYNSSNISMFKLTDVVYHASGNGSTANALSQITDKNGADATLTFTMGHEFTSAEYATDTISAVSASIRDAHGNQASSVSVKIQRGVAMEPNDDSGALTETQIILIGAVGGGGLLLLIIAVIAVVCIKKNGGCCKKKKDVAFDQNQIANEFDFGSAGSTEMTQSSKGAQRLEA